MKNNPNKTKRKNPLMIYVYSVLLIALIFFSIYPIKYMLETLIINELNKSNLRLFGEVILSILILSLYLYLGKRMYKRIKRNL